MNEVGLVPEPLLAHRARRVRLPDGPPPGAGGAVSLARRTHAIVRSLSQSPPRVLRLVSLDLTTALESDPSLDIAAYVRDQLERVPWRIFVVLPDGRVAKNREFDLSDAAIQNARNALSDETPPGGRPLRASSVGASRASG